VVVHAAAAATFGGALGAALRPSVHGPERPEVDLEIDVDRPAPVGGAAAPAREPAHNPRPAHRVSSTRPWPLEPSPAAAAVPIPTEAPVEPAPPRFALSAGTVATRPGLAVRDDAPTGSAATGATGPMGEHEVDVGARLLRATPPAYPAAAQEAQIEGDLPLEIVVDVMGRVTWARTLGHAGYGLDEAAARAVRGYLFSPAIRAGRPVSVRMRWTLQFRLR
jgi:protein TonB